MAATTPRKSVSIWLSALILMIFVQVILGGITRITGSGLSITEWKPVTGTLPPLNAAKWQEEYNKYTQTPQYEKMNVGISMGDFKFIYFWEYIHRLWGRVLGLVLFIPLLWFMWKKKIDRSMTYRIGFAVFWIGLVGLYGWIMVASGLKDKPWVNPYNLAVHLSLAFFLFAYLIWIRLSYVKGVQRYFIASKSSSRFFIFITILLCIQIFIGGVMSGTKAALVAPDWPGIQGQFFPRILQEHSWSLNNFVNYDDTPFARTATQFMHRMTAYLLIVFIVWFFFQFFSKIQDSRFRIWFLLLPIMTLLQAVLGVLTLLNAQGHIPLLLGVMHQGGSLILLGITVYVLYHLRNNKSSSRLSA